MNPEQFNRIVLTPALSLLPERMDSESARAMWRKDRDRWQRRFSRFLLQMPFLRRNVERRTQAMTIILDPGHGGADPGATREHPVEAWICLNVALACRDSLKGHRVVLTRDEDVSTSLSARVLAAKSEKADLFVSIHANAAEDTRARGFECFCYTNSQKGRSCGASLIEEYSRTFPQRTHRTWRPNEPVKETSTLYVLKNTPCPAVLFELGFVSNAEERIWMCDEETQQEMGRALARGIKKWIAG
jgi:N-acetylmuramoyl-L-alanine amidase